MYIADLHIHSRYSRATSRELTPETLELSARRKGIPVSDVPFAVTSEEAVAVVSCEFVPDAYEAILRAEREGLLRILHYAQTGDPFRAWIWQTMKHEYENAEKQPDYRHFIKGKFGIIG